MKARIIPAKTPKENQETEAMKRQIGKIVRELKDRISEKYSIQEMRIFGSTARGDRTPESDIDVWVHLFHVNRQIEEELFDMAYDLELKHDCLIDLIVVDDRVLSGAHGTAPIYEKIRAEGAAV
ncbi:MAG: nucleotidyltransferase domain-containing protein [PVC group bacterium]